MKKYLKFTVVYKLAISLFTSAKVLFLIYFFKPENKEPLFIAFFVPFIIDLVFVYLYKNSFIEERNVENLYNGIKSKKLYKAILIAYYGSALICLTLLIKGL